MYSARSTCPRFVTQEWISTLFQHRYVEVTDQVLSDLTITPSYETAVYAGWVTYCNDLITTLPESSTSCTYHLQTGKGYTTIVRMLSTRTLSKLIWYWRMFRCSAKTVRLGGPRWLLWAQLHCLRFGSSSVSSDFVRRIELITFQHSFLHQC